MDLHVVTVTTAVILFLLLPLRTDCNPLLTDTFFPVTVVIGNSSVPLCAVEGGNVSAVVRADSLLGYNDHVCVPPSVRCAWTCTQSSNCVSFMYNSYTEMCTLYSVQANIFAVVDNCTSYQVG